MSRMCRMFGVSALIVMAVAVLLFGVVGPIVRVANIMTDNTTDDVVLTSPTGGKTVIKYATWSGDGILIQKVVYHKSISQRDWDIAVRDVSFFSIAEMLWGKTYIKSGGKHYVCTSFGGCIEGIGYPAIIVMDQHPTPNSSF